MLKVIINLCNKYDWLEHRNQSDVVLTAAKRYAVDEWFRKIGREFGWCCVYLGWQRKICSPFAQWKVFSSNGQRTNSHVNSPLMVWLRQAYSCTYSRDFSIHKSVNYTASRLISKIITERLTLQLFKTYLEGHAFHFASTKYTAIWLAANVDLALPLSAVPSMYSDTDVLYAEKCECEFVIVQQ